MQRCNVERRRAVSKRLAGTDAACEEEAHHVLVPVLAGNEQQVRLHCHVGSAVIHEAVHPVELTALDGHGKLLLGLVLRR